jgi:hypothetical protein
METRKIEEQENETLKETVDADTACSSEDVEFPEAEDILRGIWQQQLVKREDRVLHGHFEGDLARKLAPIAEVYNS